MYGVFHFLIESFRMDLGRGERKIGGNAEIGGNTEFKAGIVQSPEDKSLLQFVIDIVRRKIRGNGAGLHQLHHELIGRPPGKSRPHPKRFGSCRGPFLVHQLRTYIIHGIGYFMLEQFLPVLDHGQYPVDLDIDDPGQGQSDQYNNDRKNFFQTDAFRSACKFIKRMKEPLPKPRLGKVFNEGFTKKRDFR